MRPIRPLRLRNNAAGPTDPHFSSTVLLCGFEGADASTTATDESSKLRGNANVFGNAQIDTAQFKFGASSALFDGNQDNFNWSDHADFEFTNQAFTIELWYRTNVTTGDRRIISKFGTSGARTWLLWQNGANLQWLTSTDGSSFNTDISAAHSFSTGTWYHLCVDFDGTKVRLYKNGSMIGSYSSTVRNLFNGVANVAMGCDAAGFGSCDGWIDEVRLTKGIGRYASDSGFTTPTAAYPRS